MDILTTIQNQYLSFTKKEKLIADYILTESNHIENMNISILAHLIGVSDGTITRFCKKINCASFVDLKIQLSSAIAQQNAPESNGPLEEVYNFYRQVIERTNSMMDRSALELIVDEIRRARYIYIYGMGNSGLTTCELMFRLIRMGFQGQSISDSHLMIINSSIASCEDLVIAFSVSGETVEVVNAVAIARKNKCRTLCITSFAGSSLALNSDYCFTVPNSVLVDKERFFNSQFPFLYVIDLLTTILLEDEKLKQNMNITIDTVVALSQIKQ